jgi:hypothetical protein
MSLRENNNNKKSACSADIRQHALKKLAPVCLSAHTNYMNDIEARKVISMKDSFCKELSL